MANVTVIGAQWGDEGKGKIVDWLASRADAVVRFQGGHNAGHTLVVGNEVYKLSLLPSGIVTGTLSLIGNGVVLDPWHFRDEVAKLTAQGVDINPQNLQVAENAPLILPFHRDLDGLREDASGAGKIGTTRRGIGPAYEDKVGRRSIRVCDLAHLDDLEPQLDRICAHHDALRAFEQHVLAGLGDRIERAPHRLGKGQHESGDVLQVIQQPLAIDPVEAKAPAQRIVVRADPVKLGAQRVKVRQIADPDRAAANLVLIGRADPAPGGADLARAAGIFAQGIKIAVERQDQRGILGHLQVLRVDLNPLPRQLGHFIAEVPRIEHHAVADQRQRAGDNPRGQQRKLVDLVAHHQRVPGIVPALKPHHGIGAAGQPIDDLAFAFIAPLGADHGDVRQGLRSFFTD